MRSAQCRAMSGSMGRAIWAISPSGFRTATAQLRGPRIITPSRTAWPPIACAMVGLVGRARGAVAAGLLGLLEPPLEAGDAAAGVDDLLLARVERMALRADLDVQLGLGRAGDERVAARAVHRGHDVLGMDLGLHRESRIPEAICATMLPPLTTTTGFSASTFLAMSAAAATAPAPSTASCACA